MPVRIEKDIIRIIRNSLDPYNIKLKKVFGSAYSSGEPDLTGCYRGLRIEMECKVHPNKISKTQEQCLKFWVSQGAFTCIATYLPKEAEVEIKIFTSLVSFKTIYLPFRDKRQGQFVVDELLKELDYEVSRIA